MLLICLEERLASRQVTSRHVTSRATFMHQPVVVWCGVVVVMAAVEEVVVVFVCLFKEKPEGE